VFRAGLLSASVLSFRKEATSGTKLDFYPPDALAPVLWRSMPDTLAAAGAVTADSRSTGTNLAYRYSGPGRRMVGNIR